MIILVQLIKVIQQLYKKLKITLKIKLNNNVNIIENH